MSPEILRSLSGDHDLLWLLPADLQVGDVLLIGGACVRTVLELGAEYPCDLPSETGTRWRRWSSGEVPWDWSLRTDRAVLALRPITCPVCDRPERHDPDACTRWFKGDLCPVAGH